MIHAHCNDVILRILLWIVSQHSKVAVAMANVPANPRNISPITHLCQPTCTSSSTGSPFPRSPPRPGGGDDPMRPLILISIICTTVLVLILIISVLSTAVCCWFFHRKQRSRDLCGKGGVIVLGEDLQRANQEGRLLVNVALVNVRVYM